MKFKEALDKIKAVLGDIRIDKKRLIAIALLLLMLIGLVACVRIKHKINNGSNLEGDEIVAEEVGTDDPDAWWKVFSHGDADKPESTVTKANELEWQAVPGAVGYNVYRSTSEDGEYVCIAVVEGTTYTDTSAEEGVKYYYKTTAVKPIGTEEKDGTTALITEEVTMDKKELVTEVVTVKTTKSSKSKKENKTEKKTTSKNNSATGTTKRYDSNGTTSGNVNIETTKNVVTPGTTINENVETTTQENTTQVETTTVPTTEIQTTETTTETTTQRVIPSYAGTSTGSSKVNNALSQFNKNVSSDISLYDLARKCGSASGVSSSITKTTNIKGVNGTITGYDECYRFTSNYSALNNARYFGYVFKVSDGTDPATFANTLSSNAATKYSFTGLGSTRLTYKAVAYYDQYVFFMISAQ